MKFSLIHPSRGRPGKALEAFTEWMQKASGNHSYEWLLGLDIDDPQLEAYKQVFGPFPVIMQINPNRSLIDAVNAGAKRSSGECLIVVSDDFGCPQDWDQSLAQIITPGQAQAVHINDTITTVAQGVMTLPILTRQAYEQLGHIYNPVYFSMFADNELYDVCSSAGFLIHYDLTFPHRHFTNPDEALRSKRDPTYTRQNAGDVYKLGEKIYKERKAAGFPK